MDGADVEGGMGVLFELFDGGGELLGGGVDDAVFVECGGEPAPVVGGMEGDGLAGGEGGAGLGVWGEEIGGAALGGFEDFDDFGNRWGLFVRAWWHE